MRQQLTNHAVALSWQAGQHIFEISIRIMPIEPGALNLNIAVTQPPRGPAAGSAGRFVG
jgi:hypothetical protein